MLGSPVVPLLFVVEVFERRKGGLKVGRVEVVACKVPFVLLVALLGRLFIVLGRGRDVAGGAQRRDPFGNLEPKFKKHRRGPTGGIQVTSGN